MFNKDQRFVEKDGKFYGGLYRINKILKLQNGVLLYQILPNYNLFTEKQFTDRFVLVDSVEQVQPL
jgi:hypothetical protein